MAIKVNVSEALQDMVIPTVRRMAEEAIDEEIRECQNRIDKKLTILAMDAASRINVIISRLPDEVKTQVDVVVTLAAKGDRP